MFKQPDQSVLIPLLKVVVDDLSDFWVVGEFGIERFAYNSVDVGYELVFDG